MAVSYRQFLVDLYDEHAEEAAFLYEFVLGARPDPEFPWTAAHDFEQRREAHVDALVIGGDDALARCARVLDDGPGALYTCAAVTVRSDEPRSLYERLESLDTLLDAVDPSDPESADDVVAAVTALNDALVEHASDAVLAALVDAGTASGEKTPTLALLGVALAVERRALDGDHERLSRTLRARADAEASGIDDRASEGSADATGPGTNGVESPADSGTAADGATPFGMLGAKMFHHWHLDGLEAASAPLRHACVEHLYRTGSPREIDRLRMLARPGAGNFAALGTGAGAAYSKVLLAAARTELDGDLLLALGLFGTPEWVATILPALDSEHADDAAIALHAITGAVLEEERFEEEIVDETTLFDDELVAWRKGERPRRVDGTPWGESVTALSRDPARWREWLDANKARFVAGTRYRQGQPLSAMALLATLRREHTPHRVRLYSAMELRVRYGVQAPFDVRMTVAEQIRCLNVLRARVEAIDKHPPGGWVAPARAAP